MTSQNRASASEGIIAGCVELISEREVVGWARQDEEDLPVAIEVRHGESCVARTIASVWREDLKTNGIGDGNHGFKIELPCEFAGDPRLLSVVAINRGGAAVTLKLRAEERTGLNNIQEFQKAISFLVTSQRVMHRNLQAVLLGQSQPSIDVIGEMKAVQNDVVQSIRAVETVIARLESIIQSNDAVGKPRSARHPLRSLFLTCLMVILVGSFALFRSISFQ